MALMDTIKGWFSKAKDKAARTLDGHKRDG